MIILLNGPPRSGKDTAVKFVQQALDNCLHMKMSQPLKSGLCSIFSFTHTEMALLEEFKDNTDFGYGNIHYRDMQIKLFQHLEEVYGSSILGDIFVRRYGATAAKHVVVSDAGRNTEVIPILREVRVGEVGLIEVHRPSCNFDNDIREYMSTETKSKIKYVEELHNDYDLELYEKQIQRVLRKWGLIHAD